MSVKSVSKPSKQLDFIGKAVEMLRRRVSNKTSLLAGAVSLKLQCFIEGSVPVKRLHLLLGKLEWGLRMHGGGAAFFAIVQWAPLYPPIFFSNKLAKTLLTVLALAVVPQRMLRPWSSLPPGLSARHLTLFCDAAFVGVYLPCRGIRSRVRTRLSLADPPSRSSTLVSQKKALHVPFVNGG